MDFVKEQIKMRFGFEPTIEEVFKTGSSLFCDNYKDTDYIVIVSEDLFNKVKICDKENKIDYFVFSKRYREQLINFEFNDLNELFIIDEYFKGTKTNLDIINNKNKYLEVLRNVVPKYLINPNKSWENSDNCCHKHLWWAIVGLKMIENKSYNLSDEILDIIKNCHNGTLDKSWESYVLNKLGGING